MVGIKVRFFLKSVCIFFFVLMFTKVLVALCLIAVVFAQCPEWSYSGSNGPSFWGR